VVAAIIATASVTNALAISQPQDNNHGPDQRVASSNSYPEESHSFEEHDLVSSNLHSKRAGNLDIYVAFGKRRNPGQALHWMVVTTPEGSTTATYYHVTGGPTQNKPFTRQIAAGKRLDSSGIGQTFKIGTVPDTDVNKIKAASQSTPLPATGENCQNYVVGMLQKLEAKEFVPAGTAAGYQSKIEHVSSPTTETSTSDVVDGK
jgi:hypothetical protein